VPHSGQKFKPFSNFLPHPPQYAIVGTAAETGAPQLGQNLSPFLTALPHFGQFTITIPKLLIFWSSIYFSVMFLFAP
jgi:hypothetical protein